MKTKMEGLVITGHGYSQRDTSNKKTTKYYWLTLNEWIFMKAQTNLWKAVSQ